jgi:3-dehydroquinate synthase
MIYSQSDSEIIFSANAGKTLAGIISEWKGEIFLLMDENTQKYCLPKIKNAFGHHISAFTVQAGEQAKTLATIEKIWEYLNREGADRKSLLVNLGGGVLCDMGGFAASCFKRGIDFIHIPTTLLSQVDASVGGKTGVNFKSYKNEIGTFSFPIKVIIDTRFLETLDHEHLLSGFAEMLKHAFISDQEYFYSLREINLNPAQVDFARLLPLVEQSIRIKEKVVLSDPLETGLRKILNFGHTVGHAFESYFMGSPDEISHGRAVAYGMAVELFLSEKKSGLLGDKLKEAVEYINKVYGKAGITSKDFEPLLNLMTHDKKNESAKINFSLLKDFGFPVFDQTAGRTEIMEAFERYLSF